jgi:stearoyl-CoA desaturase (delta-9 desaturase)
MGSVNQGFRWYEIDVTYYVLRVMSWFGLVWDLKVAPPHIVRGAPRRAPIQARTAAGPSPAAPAAHAPERR